MAVYTLSHLLGPILGPPVGGFINQNMAGARCGPVQITWVFVELLLLLAAQHRTLSAPSLHTAAPRTELMAIAFQAFPLIFAKHGFSAEQTGMTFLGIGVGCFPCCLFFCRLERELATQDQAILERQTLRFNGRPPPEARLYMGHVRRILVPIGLFALACTTCTSVPTQYVLLVRDLHDSHNLNHAGL
ncbi:hypothetical protein FIBSPDRAFT_899039 [Athelia psychrophila]|uniref:MFS general substrate transporter n=1 Tax=Athelia psychrophila TaxID=1759441 RepID=A0A166A7R9_9AGAM|nr:hypothetical protein FIBSPDRAFT_899039 [Fibularhizoctonia sp. CBS 109695]